MLTKVEKLDEGTSFDDLREDIINIIMEKFLPKNKGITPFIRWPTLIIDVSFQESCMRTHLSLNTCI